MNDFPAPSEKAGPEEKPFRYTYTQGLGELLQQQGITLLVSTYQAGKLCAFRGRDGGINMLPRTFRKAMGIAADKNRMAVATQYQIWLLTNEQAIAPKIEPKDTHDACYIPRRSHVTSNIDIHEIAWGGDELWVVNTLFSCLSTLDDRFSFVPRWHPPFITRLTRDDRCHLNGLAMHNGVPVFVTLFATTDTPQGWREHKIDGGLVMHVGSGEPVVKGLSMPHSPRVYDGRLWVLDSGNGKLLCIDPANGHKETVVVFDGYPRGLAFCGKFAFVGLSKIREKEVFGGVPMADDAIERHCGVAVVDIESGTTIGKIDFETSMEEVFDVQVLFGICNPAIVGFDQDTIERAAAIAPTQPFYASKSFRLLAPDVAGAQSHNSQGLKFLEQKRYQEAAACFRKAIDLYPAHDKAQNNLGFSLLELEDKEGALLHCQNAIRFNPENHRAHNNLGNALRAGKQLERAKLHYQAAVKLQPDYANAHYNLGQTLADLTEFDTAETHLQKAIRLQPDLAVAWSRLGHVLARQDKFDQALVNHDKAIEINDKDAKLYVDKALSLKAANRIEEAVKTYEDAIELDPENCDYHVDLAFALLSLGDWQQGWREHDWRLNMPHADVVRLNAKGEQQPGVEPDNKKPRGAAFTQPQWQGQALDGQTLLIWAEQGIGDEYMYASMFREVIAPAKHCVIECDTRSLSIMRRSFPGTEFVPRVNPPDVATQSGGIDYQCAMGSLPRWLRQDEKSFCTVPRPYIKSDTEKEAALRQRYNETGQELLVGISWRTANPNVAFKRNADLSFWENVLKTSGVRFISLQYGDSKQALAEIKSKFDVDIYQDPEVDSIKDLETFASQVAAMDLVISIDNSTVHMAGALGKPVWTLLSFSADWRWLQDREDTVWYPSMRLFRQSKPDDWEGVFERVAGALAGRLSS